MSKLVQVWRFMRMLVIFVIPERVEFLEKTLREFFDAKIVMTGKSADNDYAMAAMYERKGRNYKDEPIFARVKGCRYGGFIKVAPFSKKYPQEAEEYERRSRIYKTSIIMQARRDVMEASGQWTKKPEKRQRDIEEFVQKALSLGDDIKAVSKKGKQRYSEELIQNRMNIGMAKARRIRAELEIRERKNAGTANDTGDI